MKERVPIRFRKADIYSPLPFFQVILTKSLSHSSFMKEILNLLLRSQLSSHRALSVMSGLGTVRLWWLVWLPIPGRHLGRACSRGTSELKKWMGSSRRTSKWKWKWHLPNLAAFIWRCQLDQETGNGSMLMENISWTNSQITTALKGSSLIYTALKCHLQVWVLFFKVFCAFTVFFC